MERRDGATSREMRKTPHETDSGQSLCITVDANAGAADSQFGRWRSRFSEVTTVYLARNTVVYRHQVLASDGFQ